MASCITARRLGVGVGVGIGGCDLLYVSIQQRARYNLEASEA